MFICPGCREKFAQSRGLFWHFLENKPCAKVARDKGGTSPARYEVPDSGTELFMPDGEPDIHAGAFAAMIVAGALIALALAFASLCL